MNPTRRFARQTALVLLFASLATAAPLAWGQEVAQDAAFLRLSRDRKGEPASLDTSIVRYRETPAAAAAAGRPIPAEVDLVGAVHLGSRSYYDTLDRLFLDYTAQNFVHADLSPKEFDAAMTKRGESWWTMFLKLMREGAARADRPQGKGGQDVGFGDLFGILFGNDREVRLRRIMAEQFTDMEVLTAAFGGEEGSSLITDRNAAAIDVLRQQLARGKKKIAIFYGAAHMDDFDERLRTDFQMEPFETDWLEAWDLRLPKK